MSQSKSVLIPRSFPLHHDHPPVLSPFCLCQFYQYHLLIESHSPLFRIITTLFFSVRSMQSPSLCLQFCPTPCAPHFQASNFLDTVQGHYWQHRIFAPIISPCSSSSMGHAPAGEKTEKAKLHDRLPPLGLGWFGTFEGWAATQANLRGSVSPRAMLDC